MTAKTVYVTKSGNDSNSGLTLPLAKLTLAGANAISATTDTILIGPGTWTETDQLCAVSNCTYQGAGMSQTTITGNIKATSNIKLISDMRINHVTGTATIYWGNGQSILTRVFNDYTGYSSTNNTWSSMVGNLKLNQCIFYNYSAKIANFLFANNGSAIWKAYNCVFYAGGIPNGAYSIYFSYTSGTTTAITKNCIFHTSAMYYYASTSQVDTTSGLNVHSNNCFYNQLFYPSPLDVTEIIANPLFIDAAGGDFRLQANSPCIGLGTSNLP